MPEDSFKSYSEPVFDGSRRHQYFSAAGRNGEGQPSKVLRIHYPSSVPVVEYLLHNAMILFGEIENIKTYEDRNFALVQFRSVDEARLARDGLQGKLFGDPRILIEYSNSEFSPPNEAFGSYADINRSIQDKLQSEIPARQGQTDLFTHEYHVLAPRGRGYTITELDDLPLANKLQQGKHHSPLERQNLRRQSPGPGMPSSPSRGLRPQHITSSSTCDMPYATTHLRREPKRQRVGSTGHGQRRADNDYVWRGVIARGGRQVCHARCVPIGEGIVSEIPDVVNCTARTGLDMLTKHYADAVGFRIMFFLPDSEADFAPYTEFLRYLESKSRAGVARFEDGTPLFLVPPSDFLTSVLKVSGPERLYGVVLELPQTAPSVPSNQPQYSVLQSQNTYQTGYNELPKGESTLQRNYHTFTHDGVKAPLKMPGPPNPVPPVNSAAVTQPAVPLTPELIATLASLLPASNKVSGAKNSLPEAVSLALAPTVNITPNQERDQVASETWIDKHQLPERGAHPAHQLSKFPSQFTPQDHLAYESVSSSTPSFSSQMPVGYYQGKDHVSSLQPQAYVSSRAAISAIPSQQGQNTVPLPFDQHSDGMAQGTDPMSLFGSSGLQHQSNAAGTLVSGTDTSNVTPHLLGGHMPLASEADVKNQTSQNHHLNFAKHGVGPVAETEDEKNRRYQTTLMFAANLLSKVQQPEKPSGQSPGSH